MESFLLASPLISDESDCKLTTSFSVAAD